MPLIYRKRYALSGPSPTPGHIDAEQRYAVELHPDTVALWEYSLDARDGRVIGHIEEQSSGVFLYVSDRTDSAFRNLQNAEATLLYDAAKPDAGILQAGEYAFKVVDG